MGPAVTGQIALGLLDLGSISQGFVSTGQGACAHCCPAGPWDNLEQPGLLSTTTCFPSGVLFWCPQSWLCSVFQWLAEDAP